MLYVNNCFQGEIVKHLTNLHEYIHSFFATLRCLNVLTSDLPGAPLEKQVSFILISIYLFFFLSSWFSSFCFHFQLRSVYILASTSDIVKSSELKQCMTLLSFLSSDELESKLAQVSFSSNQITNLDNNN